jgi:hypothetical protein
MTDTPDNHASSAAYCPSCERFIGPAETCPYCDADSSQPRGMRWLRWGAVGFGVAGVALLVLTSRFRETSRVELGGVKPTMQFARVRMEGTVERNAFVGEKNGQVDYLSFTLADGTQTVRVAAYDEVAVALVRARQVPKAGERVKAEGSIVTGRDGRMRLRLDDARGIAIEAERGKR